MANPAYPDPPPNRPGLAIFWGGTIAGILDIVDAFVFFGFRGVSPTRILQSIASGLLGREAYQGGNATAALGLALHFSIAFSAAVVYYVASRKIAFMRERAVPAGLLYGLAVYVFMNYVVLPFVGFPRGAFSWATVANGVFAHLFLVGLPIALAARRFALSAG